MKRREPSPTGGGEPVRGDLAFAVAASLLYLGPLLVFGPVNIEQYQHSHAAVRIFHRALAAGRWPFWTGHLGFGTPLPLGENLALHPLFLLEPVVPLRWLFSLFWCLHLAAGAFFVLRLCRRLEVDRWIDRCVTVSWIASVATATYSYTDDWPALFLGWTLLPIVCYCVLLLAQTAPARARLRPALALVLLLACALLCSHLGYWLPLGIPLVIFTFVASSGRWRRLAEFATIVGAAVLLAAERILFIWQELRSFPAGLPVVTHPPFSPSAWLLEAFRPLDRHLVSLLADGRAGQAWHYLLTAKAQVRVPFFGLVFLIFAIGWLIECLRVRRRTDLARFRRATGLAFGLSLVLSILPSQSVLRPTSAIWLFRDPAILFGLLAAGVFVSELRRRSRLRDVVVVGLASFQVIQVLMVALPSVLVVYLGRDENVDFYRASRRTELARWIEGATGGKPGRLYLSPQLTYHLQREKAEFPELGLLAIGDLEPLGLYPVNGYFKNVSMDPIYPSFKLLGGRIGSSKAVIENATSFDVLGIDYLLSIEGEGVLDLSAFREATEPLTLPGGKPLRLHRNPDAWPIANLFPEDLEHLTFAQRTDCPAPGLLCADLEPLARLRLPDLVGIRGDDGGFTFDLPNASSRRILVLSYLYRPAWRARSVDGRRLRTFSVDGALVAVAVPPGVARVEMSYVSTGRRIMACVAIAGLLAICALFLASTPRRVPNPPGSAAQPRVRQS